jgi:transposase InsO family protein
MSVHPVTRGENRTVLAERGITVSMSRKGDCWDNAMMESFWGTVKTECVQRQVFATRHEARAILFDYLEIFYVRSVQPKLAYLRQGMAGKETILDNS